MKSVNAFCDRLIENGAADAKPNQHGNTVHRMFLPDSRYRIDFADDFTAEHWQQYDTDQDAEYFGVWVNPIALRILTYAEGDWSLVCCLDCNHFDREVIAMNEFYGEGFVAKAIDSDGGMTTYRQDRTNFLISGDRP